MFSEIENQYQDFMQKETGRDEYQCKVSMFQGSPLTDEDDEGCGGVVVYNSDQRIWCQNTINRRLDQSLHGMMPLVRKTLFPKPVDEQDKQE